MKMNKVIALYLKSSLSLSCSLHAHNFYAEILYIIAIPHDDDDGDDEGEAY
jgi:hypothetical protein